MLRIILVASTVVLFLIFSIPILGILALVGKGNSRAKQDWSLRIVRSVFRFILKLAGVTITVQGLENIPGPCSMWETTAVILTSSPGM